MKGKRKIAKKMIQKAAQRSQGVLKAWKDRMAMRHPDPRLILSPFYAWRVVYR